jgi:uncharacterized protein (TIGR03086 family)
MTMDLHQEMAAAAAEDARVVTAAADHPLETPTPCTEWDLRTLLNHTILWTAYSAERRARDEPLPDELTSTNFTAEPGYAQAYAAQLDKAVAAWSDPGAWNRELNMMGSPTPSADIGALLVAEMVLHGWDVARATGQDYHCDGPLLAAAAQTVAANAELFRQYQGFAAPVDLPPDASGFDRLLATSGRDPGWTPS